MKKTGFSDRNEKHVKNYIIALIILIIFSIFLGRGFIEAYKLYIIEKSFYNLVILLVSGFLFLFVFFPIILSFLGNLSGKRKAAMHRIKGITNNPYIYYRELPNTYGVGIASLLNNSKIENEKDIVAIILNLCAKKYLSLRKENQVYTIRVLKNIDSSLLANEKYIISCILYNTLDKIDYKEWFNYCMQDGIKLGLFRNVKQKKVNYKKYDNNFTLIFKGVYIGGYNGKKMIDLELTEKGIVELQKLYSFRNFLADFGNFANKNPEEIYLWDYYLCYAQVFGLTDTILKSGYDKIIKNSSFEIGNLDSIHLDKLNVII